jgi:A/G-specific adenine glycosylase
MWGLPHRRALRRPRCGDVEAFPAPKAKRVVPQRVRVVGVAEKAGKLLLVRRPDEGLFSGLYDLPSAWVEGEVSPEAALNAAWGPLRLGREIGQVDHVLTHMKIHQRVFQLLDFQCEIEAPTAWVDPASPAGVGLSTLTRKSLALLVENPG